MVKYEHTYDPTPAMIAIPFAKSVSSPASISNLKTQIVSTVSSLDPTIEEVETMISESPTDFEDEDIIREVSDESESRESAPNDEGEIENETEEEEEEEEEAVEEEEHHDEDNKSEESHEFVPHRADGHTFYEAAMLGLDGTPTALNSSKKKKKDGTSLASDLNQSLRASLKRNKSQNGGGSFRGSLKRGDSYKKEIKKPTSTAAAVVENLPPTSSSTTSAPRDEEGFVPHRADGHTYFEAAMLGLDGTPTAGKKNDSGKKKSKMPSFRKKK